MKIIKRECNIRHYVYKAHLTETGKLSKITAGCRTWKSFDEARAHYASDQPSCFRWSDAWIARRINDSDCHRLRAERLEARRILDCLYDDVRAAQAHIRAKRRKARAAA